MLDDNLFATQKDEMDYSDVIFNIVAWKEQSCTQEAMYDASMWGTETGDQRGGEWEPIKISSEIDPSAYIPKSPQPLEPRIWESSYGLAIS